MPFNLDELNPSAKFYYNDTEWVELRLPPISKIKEFRRQCFKTKAEYYRPKNFKGKPFRYEVEDVDDEKLNELLWDFQIVNWHLEDDKGRTITCDKDNKLLLMGNSAEFAEFVVDSLNQLSEDNRKRREQSEKN